MYWEGIVTCECNRGLRVTTFVTMVPVKIDVFEKWRYTDQNFHTLKLFRRKSSM